LAQNPDVRVKATDSCGTYILSLIKLISSANAKDMYRHSNKTTFKGARLKHFWTAGKPNTAVCYCYIVKAQSPVNALQGYWH